MAGHEPAVERGQPRDRLLLAQAGEHVMRVLLELFQGYGGAQRKVAGHRSVIRHAASGRT